MDHSTLLARIPMFDGLSPEDLHALATSFVERNFTSGQVIMNQGDRGTSMFLVAEGHVNIFLPGEASRRISLKDVSEGEYFGELALFDDKPRSASAITTSDALLFELDRGTLERYLTTRPHAAMVLLRTMSTRLRETNEMLSQRAAKNAVQDIESNLTWSQRLADKVAEINGSWAFIIALLVATLIWTLLNSESLHAPQFDPYPYQLFNLALAILVGLQGPLIVMSQNRSTIKDRAQAETDFKVNLKNEVNIETLLREVGEMRAETHSRFEKLEQTLATK
jgi:CRP/FNR family transcriptional regulator, cyclic AMP receptor protein